MEPLSEVEKERGISGVILAGGDNKRFGGKIKANEIIGGEKIISRILRTISKTFNEIIIVTNTPDKFIQFPGCIITGDHFQKAGPLGGIHAAMTASTCEAVFVFACDMPFLSSYLIDCQIEYYKSKYSEAVVPVINNSIEPLHAIYRNILCGRIESCLSLHMDNSIKGFLTEAEVNYFKLDKTPEVLQALMNVNTPKAADEAEQISGIE